MPDSAAPAYHHRANPDLLRLIPRDAGVVVEVGCGGGALGTRYKTFNPACRYIGVEIDGAAAAIAREHLDGVIEGDVETLDPASLPIPEGRSVDCLIFGDALEHLRDPWSVLVRQVERLSEDGVVLACIPNVQHWTLIEGLLRGQWRYQNEGLLDRTHLRFFTLEGALDLFTAAGLVVHDVLPRVFNAPAFEAFFKAAEPTLDALKIDKARFAQQGRALQYVVRAGRRPARRLLLQAMALKPAGAVNDVRIDLPLSFQATIPGTRVSIGVQQASLGLRQPNEDAVFIWHRPVLQRSTDLAKLRTLLRAGYTVVTEFDDHPMRWPGIEANDYLTFRGVHAVQTSTEPLADLLRQWNPNVAVFPNTVAELPPFPERSGREEVVLFFGALNRQEDWGPILPALNRVLTEAGGQVRVEVVHDRAFFDALATEKKRFTPTCGYDVYKDRLRDCDIALLPLEDTLFNRMKSDLKFVEVASCGAVALASPTVYAGVVRDGETGVLFRNPEEFASQLISLITDAPRRQRVARSAYDWVKENRLMSGQYRARQRWYEWLTANRSQLHAELLGRVPELAAD